MAGTPENPLVERLDQRRSELGISDRELSMRVTGKPDLVRDIKRKGHHPSAENLARLAEALGVSADWLLGRAESPAPVLSEVSVADRRIEFHGATPEDPLLPIVGTGDCAALDVETESGELVHIERSSFDPEFHVRYIACPPALRGTRDLFAIYFHGDSMEPRFNPGEVGIVDPHRTPRPGDDVLVQLRADGSDDVESVLVKRLVRQAGGFVELQQFNPPLVFRLARTKVKRIQRIIPPTDLLL